MKKIGLKIIYIFFISLFSLFIGMLVMHEVPALPTQINKTSFFAPFLHDLFHHLKEPLSQLTLQLILIVSVTRLFGYLCMKISQPSVVGQIIAGIVMGPSLMGYFFPEFFNFIFPPESLKSLKLVSNLGLIFYMFIIGMELDIQALKNKAHQAVVISNAGIIIPFSLGIILSLFLYKSHAPETISLIPFVLFIGIAMSITAFPVLARIVQERGISKTNLGVLALTCAAIDDVTAWCLLVGVIAIATAGSIYGFLITLILSIAYVLFMLKIVKPFLKEYSRHYLLEKNLHKTVVTAFFVVMLASSYISDIIGIHALFGAFMAGIAMPHNLVFKKNFVEKIEDVSLVLLLPTFFVLSGLNTQINLLNDWSKWLLCLVVIIVAVAGKFGGCTIATKLVGENWKNSLSIGVLMNSRGLMELIVLNVGYELGILKSEMFTIFVFMALITTFLTNPGLNLIEYIFKNHKDIDKTNELD